MNLATAHIQRPATGMDVSLTFTTFSGKIRQREHIPHHKRSPRSPMPHLLIAAKQVVQIQNASFTVGSDPTCDLALSGRDILPRHLILQRRHESWQILPLSPYARTIINDHPLTTLKLLNDGDRIQVGEVTLIWSEKDAPNVHDTPWKGLLFIFLALMVMMSVIIAGFSINQNYRLASQTTPATSPTVANHSTNIAPTPAADFSESSPAGHPVYHITLPPLQETSSP